MGKSTPTSIIEQLSLSKEEFPLSETLLNLNTQSEEQLKRFLINTDKNSTKRSQLRSLFKKIYTQQKEGFAQQNELSGALDAFQNTQNIFYLCNIPMDVVLAFNPKDKLLSFWQQLVTRAHFLDENNYQKPSVTKEVSYLSSKNPYIALEWACENGKHEELKHILGLYTSYARKLFKKYGLNFISSHGHPEVLKIWLVLYGNEEVSKQFTGEHLLTMCDKGHHEVLDILINSCPKEHLLHISLKTNKGDFVRASRNHHVNTVKALMEFYSHYPKEFFQSMTRSDYLPLRMILSFESHTINVLLFEFYLLNAPIDFTATDSSIKNEFTRYMKKIPRIIERDEQEVTLKQ